MSRTIKAKMRNLNKFVDLVAGQRFRITQGARSKSVSGLHSMPVVTSSNVIDLWQGTRLLVHTPTHNTYYYVIALVPGERIYYYYKSTQYISADNVEKID